MMGGNEKQNKTGNNKTMNYEVIINDYTSVLF